MDVVIARYNENLDWINIFDDCKDVRLFVYNKSDKNWQYEGKSTMSMCSLDNIGREAHSFLHHIVTNYDNLAEKTMFLQGHPFDHEVSPSQLVGFVEGEDKREIIPISSKKLFKCDKTGRPNHGGLPIGETYKQILPKSEKIDIYYFSSGAQYLVAKECIKNKPLKFWENLLELSVTDKKFPWTIERLWGYIYLATEV